MNHFSIICIHCFILFYSTVCFGEVGSFSEIVGGGSKVITEALFFKRDKKLWVMDSEGSNQRQLTKYDVQEFMVSKNGAVILFKSNLNWYVFKVASKKCQKIPDGYIKTGGYYSPALSPDGTKVAIICASSKFTEKEAKRYYTNVSAEDVNKTNIYLYDVNAGGRSELVADISGYLLPKQSGDYSIWKDQCLFWSEDGSKLHFQRSFDPYDGKCSPDDTYIIDVNSRKIKYLGKHDQIQAWRSDVLVYVNPEECYFVYTSSRRRKSATNSSSCVRISPDGTRVVFVEYPDSLNDKNTKLILDSSGGRRQLFRATDIQNMNSFWGKTDDEIYYSYGNKQGTFLKKIRINPDRSFAHTSIAEDINIWSIVFVPSLSKKFNLVQNIDGCCKQVDTENDQGLDDQTTSSGSFSDFVRD